MSARATDAYLEALERKPAAKARAAQAKEAYQLSVKRKTALHNLTGGGFLVPKSSVLKEGLEELRELGHAKADVVERINRRRKT